MPASLPLRRLLVQEAPKPKVDEGLPHYKWRNYDDLNEFFWSVGLPVLCQESAISTFLTAALTALRGSGNLPCVGLVLSQCRGLGLFMKELDCLRAGPAGRLRRLAGRLSSPLHTSCQGYVLCVPPWDFRCSALLVYSSNACQGQVST